MSLKSNFELMADYNQWMNESIYESASNLSAEELSKDRGAFFGSIIGTLNHVLVGDTIWLKRFANHPSALKALDYVCGLENPQALNSIIHAKFESLKSARIEMDRAIQNFAHELTDEALSSVLSYNNTKGEPFAKNFGYLIQHFFNHQAHHRGQVSTLLNQAGIEIGVTDLLVSIPNE
ncbi:DinB family protein [Microbulbifer sp. JMSA003]|uniref:DinB family protein n=1 Tax=Microbulbifer sp. JMSA003 TaxID=3243369 RepID=UPI0040398C5C